MDGGRFPAISLALFGAIAIAGCSAVSVGDYAQRHAMTVRELEGSGFRHLVVERWATPPTRRLDIYIEGDGIPWTGNYPSADPTPRNTLALRLAEKDPNDSAYVGRPCYFHRATAGICQPRYWTSDRYGEEVLASMALAITRLRQPYHSQIVLIGHSGGGALAALLASRVDDVIGVITIAANLDVDAWTRLHGYDPLTGSLNPIEEPRNPAIPLLQLVGGKDKSVPAAISRGYSLQQPNVELVHFERFGHVCCWEEVWGDVLQEFLDPHDSSMRHSGE